MTTKEKNRSIGNASYYDFVFLFGWLVVASQLCFCLITLISLLLGRDIIGQVIGGVVLIERKVSIGLLGLFL